MPLSMQLEYRYLRIITTLGRNTFNSLLSPWDVHSLAEKGRWRRVGLRGRGEPFICRIPGRGVHFVISNRPAFSTPHYNQPFRLGFLLGKYPSFLLARSHHSYNLIYVFWVCYEFGPRIELFVHFCKKVFWTFGVPKEGIDWYGQMR